MKKAFISVWALAAATAASAQIYITEGQFSAHSVTNEGVAVGTTDQFSPFYIWDAPGNYMYKIGGVSAGNGVGGLARFADDGKTVLAPMMCDSIPVPTTWVRAEYDKFADYVITDITRKTNNELMATAMSADGTKGILLSSKNGQIWRRSDYDGCFSTGVTAIGTMNYSSLFIGGLNGTLYYSRNEGASYSKKDARPEGVTDEVKTYCTINFLPAADNAKSQYGVFGVELTDGGYAVYYTNDYATTTAVAEGVEGIPAHICNDGINYYMVTKNGHIQKSEDQGQTWVDVFSTEDGSALKRICMADENNGVAVADNCIYLTTDGGETWTKSTVFGPEITPFAAVDAQWNDAEYRGSVITLAGKGIVARSTDNGAHFEVLEIGGADYDNYAAVINTGDYYTVLADNGVFYSAMEAGYISGATAGIYHVDTDEWTLLPTFGIAKDLSVSSPYQYSGDGNYAVGLSSVIYEPTNQVQSHATLWDIKNNQVIDLGSKFADNNRFTRANAVSYDGSVVAGWQDIYGPWYASVWKRGENGQYTQKLMLLDPTKDENLLDYKNYEELDANLMGYAFAVSADGKWIGGSGGARNAWGGPWLYNEEEGYIFIMEDQGCVSDITNDGSMAVGWEGLGSNAWMWKKDDNGGNGQLYYLHDYAKDVLKADMGEFVICSVYDISPNGRYVTGYGMIGMDCYSYVLDLEYNTSAISSKAIDQVKAAVYPNPVANELHVDLPFDGSDINTVVTLVDMQGRVVRQINTTAQSNSIDVTALTAGCYILDVNAAGTHKSFKVLVKH